ncbi:MAG: hypothetical protein PHR20_03035 [Bacteroidales bacterium]|nr:hypothetical protein [Bacteroidales bacterium]
MSNTGKIKYTSLQSIEEQKEKLHKKINKQEKELRQDWEEIKNPFKRYLPMANKAIKTLTLLPAIIDGFSLGSRIFRMVFRR